MRITAIHKSHKYILLTSLLLIIILVTPPYVPLFKYVHSSSSTNTDINSSPSFPNQEIIDPDFDWIHMKNKSYTRYGDYSTNIESVDYYSDGQTLSAILWLYFPFQVNQSYLNQEVNYGMYIDADFNQRTGFGGIDYKFEISWNNQSKKWTKVLEKWSHFGEKIVLDNQSIPYTDFSDDDAHYVKLFSDLDAMLYPKKYKVVFFAEVRRDGYLITDFTRMVAIPPLELTLSSSPRSVELRKGETKAIEVRVNTTQGYEPTVNLSTSSQSRYIISDFTLNDTPNRHDYTLRIPSYGIATIPLRIASAENVPLGTSTLFVFANSSFPPEQLIESNSNREANEFLPSSALTSENIFTQSSLLVTVNEPLTWIDHIGNFWNRLGESFSVFITGIITGLVPWIYSTVRERLKNDKKHDHN